MKYCVYYIVQDRQKLKTSLFKDGVNTGVSLIHKLNIGSKIYIEHRGISEVSRRTALKWAEDFHKRFGIPAFIEQA